MAKPQTPEEEAEANARNAAASREALRLLEEEMRAMPKWMFESSDKSNAPTMPSDSGEVYVVENGTTRRAGQRPPDFLSWSAERRLQWANEQTAKNQPREELVTDSDLRAAGYTPGEFAKLGPEQRLIIREKILSRRAKT